MKERKTTEKDLALARRIKKFRKRAEMTQEQLSDRSGLSVTFIGLLETARRRPSLQSLKKLASAMKTKVRDLINF